MLSQSYQELFQAYMKDLRWAIEDARERREAQIATLAASFDGDEARAREAVEEEPLCEEPQVIGVIRQYWLACDRLDQSRKPGAIEPLDFIYHFFQHSAPELYAILSSIQYWPIGQNEKEEWV